MATPSVAPSPALEALLQNIPPERFVAIAGTYVASRDVTDSQLEIVFQRLLRFPLTERTGYFFLSVLYLEEC